MVNCPRWVMYDNTLYQVMSRKGDMLMVRYNSYEYGWHDPRSNSKYEPKFTPLPMDKCIPITDEVAQIMRSV